MPIDGDIAGHVLGRYELLVPIATGGMAAVWAARSKGARGFQKIVAIKIMHPDFAEDPNFQTMFLDEAKNASGIRHPNVAEILDLGEQDGVLYQVMEWVDGEPLHEIMRAYDSPLGLPLALAVRIGAQTCAGLHAAHELCDERGRSLGLVHRDVSPQNVMISYDGLVKIVDFGVAKAATNTQQTATGQMKGKAPYMAPEQALSLPVDRRTDVFALGIVLYQISTGVHPFCGDNDLATLQRICDKVPAVPPRLVAPGYPLALDRVLCKALAKDPDQRWETMDQMLVALEAALPVEGRATTVDLASFMDAELGDRGTSRRQTIRHAVSVLERAAAEPANASRSSGGERHGVRPSAPRGGPGVTAPPRPRSEKPRPAHGTPAPRRADSEQSPVTGILVFLALAAAIAATSAWYVRYGSAPPPAPSAAPSVALPASK